MKTRAPLLRIGTDAAHDAASLPQVRRTVHLGALSEVLPEKGKAIAAQSRAIVGPQ